MAKKTKKHKRPSWDEYFMEVTKTVAKRATCDRGRSGCVIVKDKRILCTGYVGSPVGIEHCDEIGHELLETYNEKGENSVHCVRTSHAEQNAIAQAARFGISIDGATLYCKMEPCYICAKIIINAGVKRVVAEMRYHAAERTREVFKKAGVQMDVLKEKMVYYKKQ